jgi:hypothetical protein
MLLAPGDDPLGEGGPNAWEARDLRHVGAVEVDPLPGEQRSREPGRVPGGGAEPTGRRRVHGDELHVARRGGLGGGERQSHTGTGKSEEGQQERRSAIIHKWEDRTHLQRLKDQILAGGVRKSQTIQRLDAQTHSGKQ